MNEFFKWALIAFLVAVLCWFIGFGTGVSLGILGAKIFLGIGIVVLLFGLIKRQ